MTNFGSWEFTCDLAKTCAAYAQVKHGNLEKCDCNGCRNFVRARETAFPDKFLRLLETLGIDPQKDGEIFHCAQLSPGRHSYSGWFHFVGTLEKTGDFAPIELGEGFIAWLCHSSAPALSSLKGLPLVQVEFNAENVPWLLNEPEPQ